MTTDNAIAVLRRMQEPDPFEPQITQVAFDALEMAIQALSAKGDMVYRQAAIDAIEAEKQKRGDYLTSSYVGFEVSENVIKALPSAQPEQITMTEEERRMYKKLRTFHSGSYAKLLDKLFVSAQPEPQWISCSKRLPEANGRYLVTRGLNACGSLWNRVYIINYSDLMGIKSERIWWDGNVGKSDFQKINDVIAWCELPDPWRGEEQ